MDPLPPYTAVVLAGGKAARLGGRAKPQLEVGGRTMLAAVLAAVEDAERRVVVGPEQPVPADVVLVRERPPGGGPVTALRAGLDEVSTETVAVLAGDLPFLTASLIAELRRSLTSDGTLVTSDGTLVVDDTGRDQLLLGCWRTAAVRRAVGDATGPTSLRKVFAPLAVRRIRPVPAPGIPPPWLDCDTPADLARARTLADGERAPRPPGPAAPTTSPTPPVSG